MYLFGGVGRLGEDGLPVRPYKHDEREVEEDQVDNWRETQSKASGQTAYSLIRTSKLPLKSGRKELLLSLGMFGNPVHLHIKLMREGS